MAFISKIVSCGSYCDIIIHPVFSIMGSNKSEGKKKNIGQEQKRIANKRVEIYLFFFICNVMFYVGCIIVSRQWIRKRVSCTGLEGKRKMHTFSFPPYDPRFILFMSKLNIETRPSVFTQNTFGILNFSFRRQSTGICSLQQWNVHKQPEGSGNDYILVSRTLPN